jgi:hypothetical protein
LKGGRGGFSNARSLPGSVPPAQALPRWGPVLFAARSRRKIQAAPDDRENFGAVQTQAAREKRWKAISGPSKGAPGGSVCWPRPCCWSSGCSGRDYMSWPGASSSIEGLRPGCQPQTCLYPFLGREGRTPGKIRADYFVMPARCSTIESGDGIIPLPTFLWLICSSG